MIILASNSPRRKDLLTQAGIEFIVEAFDIDETALPAEPAIDYVRRLAAAKANYALAQTRHYSRPIIIAADTTVSVDGNILGKPTCQADAFAMWQQLSARVHQVITGVAVASANQCLIQHVSTDVCFAAMDAADMQWYWQTGEPLGKAGAYAIQGLAAQFIPSIHGSYSNVVGLPIYETLQLLKQMQQLHNNPQ